MALGDDFFIQTFTTTLQKYEKQLVDNVMLSHPTLELFKANAKSQTGRGLVVPVRAANLGATGYSDASGTHSTSVSSDIMGSAVFTWASGIITPFRLQHRDILQNSGPEQIVSLVEEYVKGAAGDHGDFITAQMHVNGADYAAGSIIPIDMLFGNAGADAYYASVNVDWAPVGGIDPNTAGKEYWQSTRLEIPAEGTGSMDIVAAFRKVLNEIYRASRKRPTVSVVGFDVYEELEAFLQEKGQYQNPGGSAQTRFSEIKVGDLTVRLDPDCADDRAYFITPDSLRFAYCAGEFMKAYPAQPLQGTLDTVVPLASTLQIGVAERRSNGLLIRT